MSLTDADRAFAEEQRVGHLATVDGGGSPHVVPICFAVRGDFVYFIVDEKPKRNRLGLRRLRNISEDPRVALILDHYEEDWSRLSYLQIRGAAAQVEDAVEYEDVVTELKRRYRQYRTVQFSMDRNPLVRIESTHIHRWPVTPTTVSNER